MAKEASSDEKNGLLFKIERQVFTHQEEFDECFPKVDSSVEQNGIQQCVYTVSYIYTNYTYICRRKRQIESSEKKMLQLMFCQFIQTFLAWTIPNYQLATKVFMEESLFRRFHVWIHSCNHAHTTRFVEFLNFDFELICLIPFVIVFHRYGLRSIRWCVANRWHIYGFFPCISLCISWNFSSYITR